jgi:hypothetical protein
VLLLVADDGVQVLNRSKVIYLVMLDRHGQLCEPMAQWSPCVVAAGKP